MKSIVKFFRKRALMQFVEKNKSCIIPDINTYPTIAVLVDLDQLNEIEAIKAKLSERFIIKEIRFFAFADAIPQGVTTNAAACLITKRDFNFWGIMREERRKEISLLSYDIFLDLSNNADDLLTHDYFMTLLKSSMRVNFSGSYNSLYDIVIDSKKNENLLFKLDVFNKYLNMLGGKNNEK
ncbi:MAG: DUF6913 domain-containing protein [Candidatus Limimorpha sp.]